MRILIAEDDKPIAIALRDSLVECGYAVDCVDDGASAEHALLVERYDLLVLDLGLPRTEGGEVLKHIRHQGCEVPVLVVTARDGISERVRTLDDGADDYLVKPFVLSEFLARSRALLRRRASGGLAELSVGQLRLRLGARRVWMGAEPLELTAREYALLEALFVRQKQVVSRNHLMEAVTDWESDLSDNGLDIAVHRLRRKLLGSGARLRTIRGLGYLLEEAVGDS
jgi:two-component system, OmpR family, response regulator